jgi:hypothetical protein
MVRRRWGSSPGFLGNPFGSMPRARDSGDPGATSHIGRPGAAFRLVNGVGITTSRVFGAESSRPASLLCTLRTHQSPGEWQHSLPVCLLDCDRAGLTPAGFHQEVSPSHSRFLLFQAFPSAMTMSAVSSSFEHSPACPQKTHPAFPRCVEAEAQIGPALLPHRVFLSKFIAAIIKTCCKVPEVRVIRHIVTG